MIAERNIYTDAKGEITTDRSQILYLLVAKGCEVPFDHQAKVAAFFAKAKPKPAENKAVAPEVELKFTVKAEDDAQELPKKRITARKPRRK